MYVVFCRSKKIGKQEAAADGKNEVQKKTSLISPNNRYVSLSNVVRTGLRKQGSLTRRFLVAAKPAILVEPNSSSSFFPSKFKRRLKQP